jgi:hypothetical protein
LAAKVYYSMKHDIDKVGGLERSNDPESYAGGSYATGRVSLAGQVDGDDPD